MDMYRIIPVNKPVYSTCFSINSPALSGHQATIYAECSINAQFRGSNDYYFLELFLEVDSFGDRNHIVGLYFGSGQMSQETLDTEILSYVDSELNETFPVLVRRCILKEQLLEDWCDSHME